MLQGLAFAHEAGVAHRDLQPYSLLVDDDGNVQAAGPRDRRRARVRAVRPRAGRRRRPPGRDGRAPHAAPGRRDRRAGLRPGDAPGAGRQPRRWTSPTSPSVVGPPAAVRPRDGAPAVDGAAPDRRAAARHRQPRHRSPGAPALSQRAHLRARARRLAAGRASDQDAGPITLLLGRMRSVGLLPAMPGGADARRAAGAAGERRTRTSCPSVVLQDFALSFELLRMVNFAQSQAGNAGSGAGAGDPPRDRDGGPGRRAPGGAVAASLAGPAQRRGRQRARRADRSASSAPARIARALQPAGYDQRGRLPDHRAAEPRLAGRAVPLPRRGRADPPPDAAGAAARRPASPTSRA